MGTPLHDVAELHVPDDRIEVFRRDIADPDGTGRPVSLRIVSEKEEPVSGLPDGQRDRRIGLVRLFKGDRPRLDDRLEFRLVQIESVVVDIFLDHRVDQVRDVAALVDVFPDPAGGDLLQFRRKLQLDEPAGDAVQHAGIVAGVRFPVPHPPDDDVVHGPYLVVMGALLVEGGVGDDVRAHHQVDLPSREHGLQPLQVLRIARIDRYLVRKQVYVVLAGNTHVDDLAADEVGLGPLGPGELIHGQIHFKSHIGDHFCDPFVGKCERIESAREESHLAADPALELSFQQPVLSDVAVETGQTCRPVEVREPVSPVLVHLEVDPARCRKEDVPLLQPGQVLRAEYGLPEHQERLLAHRFPVACHSLQQKSDEVLPPPGAHFAVLFEPLRIPRVVFQKGPDRIECDRSHVIGGTGLHGFQGRDQLVQLLGREPQRHLAQPPRDRT